MPADSTPLQPGATYKFVVRSTEEAVETIRTRLGEEAKVLSVRQLTVPGLAGLFSKPRLEVIVQAGEPEAAAKSPEVDTFSLSSVATGASPSVAHGRLQEAAGAGERTSSTAFYGLAGATALAENPTRDQPPRLSDVLRRSGFSESLLGRLQGTAAFRESQRPLHQALAEVGQQIRRHAERRPSRPLPARVAFLGTPGVGRTTALCKWLAKEVFAHRRMGRVLKAEFDKPNPAEGLAVFCEALGLTLENYSPEAGSGTAPDASLDSAAGGFLLADLPGLSLRRPEENSALTAFLDREKFEGRVLVLNAVYDTGMLRRAYATGCDLGATHVVFTHLDELDHWGKLWDFLLEGPLSPLFLATGPSLTGDCEEETVGAVLRRTLPGA